MSDIEHAIIKTTQGAMRESGVTLSENDTILFLIQRAQVPDPIDIGEAEAMCRMHWQVCADCTQDKGPQCAAGVHLRNAYNRIKQVTEHRRQAAAFAQQHGPASAAAASVAAAARGVQP